jgi:hypothetical protein
MLFLTENDVHQTIAIEEAVDLITEAEKMWLTAGCTFEIACRS